MKLKKLKRSTMARAATANLEKKLKEKKQQSNIEQGPFDIKSIMRHGKAAPTWGMLREVKKNLNVALSAMRDKKNEALASKKHLFFSRLAPADLYAHAIQYLEYAERDISAWETILENVFKQIDGKFGRIQSQDDVRIWLEIYDLCTNLQEGITNTVIPAYQLYDQYFNTFTYQVIGLSIPEFMVLEEGVQKAYALQQFQLATKKYNDSLLALADEDREALALPAPEEFFKVDQEIAKLTAADKPAQLTSIDVEVA